MRECAKLEREVPSADAMQSLGAAIADVCHDNVLIFLQGELGAGKTTLTRGFLRQLGVVGPVRSPTYTLIEPYEVGESVQVYHLDLYRIADPDELELIGVRDLIAAARVLVEWPERAGDWLPEPDLSVCIDCQGPTQRRVRLSGRSAPGREMLRQLAIGGLFTTVNFPL